MAQAQAAVDAAAEAEGRTGYMPEVELAITVACTGPGTEFEPHPDVADGRWRELKDKGGSGSGSSAGGGGGGGGGAHGLLTVHVCQAINLQAADLNGMSDPYAEVTVGCIAFRAHALASACVGSRVTMYGHPPARSTHARTLARTHARYLAASTLQY